MDEAIEKLRIEVIEKNTNFRSRLIKDIGFNYFIGSMIFYLFQKIKGALK